MGKKEDRNKQNRNKYKNWPDKMKSCFEKNKIQ